MCLTMVVPAPLADDAAQNRFSVQLSTIASNPDVTKIIVLHTRQTAQVKALVEISSKIQLLRINTWFSGRGMTSVLDRIETPYFALGLPGEFFVEISGTGLERLVKTARTNDAGLVYSDLRDERANVFTGYPLIDYQLGSVSEMFDFGGLVLISKTAAEQVLRKYGPIAKQLCWAAFYDLRLKIAIDFPIIRIPEPVYTRVFTSISAPTSSGQDLANFLGPDSREYHLEMEQVLTAHLRCINACLEPQFAPPPPPQQVFPVTASIVIPVHNREKTIGDALNSALLQVAPFSYNVIVVDHQSTDGTTRIIQQFARKSKRLIHLIPRRSDLGVGGLWNHAIESRECGMFAVQLDSDDVYSDARALEKIVATFFDPADLPAAFDGTRPPKVGMVIGSYTAVNFNLKEIEPGLVDHREWTRENGHNNALRISGLGAPRAYYVPVVRRTRFPDFMSYAEDYASCLWLSREYEIARCYESLYLVRRWDENSDRKPPLVIGKAGAFKEILSAVASKHPEVLESIWPIVLTLVTNTRNRFEHYRDWIRTVEIIERQKLVARRSQARAAHAAAASIATEPQLSSQAR